MTQPLSHDEAFTRLLGHDLPALPDKILRATRTKTATTESPFRVRLRLFPPIFFLWGLTRFIGLRSRLRCPECRAVGTWKPHSSCQSSDGSGEVPRRWLCKWCGYYNSPRSVPEDIYMAYVSAPMKEWRTPDTTRSILTPARALAESQIPRAWPWTG